MSHTNGFSIPASALTSLMACALLTLGCTSESEVHGSEKSGRDGVHWGYSGDIGPEHWGDLSPEFVLCKIGREQSPIDIELGIARTEGSALSFDYQLTTLDLDNNGHTIQQTILPGSFLTVDKKQYQLLQFHFHSKSEHTLGGQQLDLELHLVHQSEDGEYAVIGQLYKLGAENAFLKTFWDRLPADTERVVHDETAPIDTRKALPENTSYFAYDGSFTTPPGTEGVKWHLMKTVAECSAKQLEAFRAIHSGNFRPVQALNGREVELH